MSVHLNEELKVVIDEDLAQKQSVDVKRQIVVQKLVATFLNDLKTEDLRLPIEFNDSLLRV